MLFNLSSVHSSISQTTSVIIYRVYDYYKRYQIEFLVALNIHNSTITFKSKIHGGIT